MSDAGGESPVVEAVIDVRLALHRFENDLELLREVAQLFVADCPRRLREMRRALACGDATTLQRVAHSIKGSVSNFAAMPAARAALRLETLASGGDLTAASELCTALEHEVERLVSTLTAFAEGGSVPGGHAQPES